MDSTKHKLYHIHGMDSRDLSDLYYSDKEDMAFGEDSLIFPMMNLHYQQLQEKESRLKSSVKQILKCDFEEENITSPVELPLADCVLCAWILDIICKNEDEYMRNLEKILKLLKPGGHMLLFSTLDATYVTIRGERFHVFTHVESFVKNTLSKLGLVIDYCAVQRRRNVSDLIDYKAVMFIVANKRE
ncbi:nicotinamide N-methyltransferase-like [Mantella aurantiaca]